MHIIRISFSGVRFTPPLFPWVPRLTEPVQSSLRTRRRKRGRFLGSFQCPEFSEKNDTDSEECFLLARSSLIFIR